MHCDDTHLKDFENLLARMSLLNAEFQICDLEADLILEVCSYLGVHDQETMKRICQWWRWNLSDNDACLSRLVEVDGSRMLKQSGYLLEHTLNLHVQKNTQVLVLRHMALDIGAKFGVVLKAVKEKQANLISLIFKDCSVQREHAGTAWCWLKPEKVTTCSFMLHGLLFITKKLIFVNYTIRNALGGVLTGMNPAMPCSVPFNCRYLGSLPLPIVLPRHEFDCSKPFVQHYHGFIMALNFHCPEVNPEIRNQVVQLYNSWVRSDVEEDDWKSLARLIKCLNEGVPVKLFGYDDFHRDLPALRQLDPLTLNKLTIEVLYRLYF